MTKFNHLDRIRRDEECWDSKSEEDNKAEACCEPYTKLFGSKKIKQQ